MSSVVNESWRSGLSRGMGSEFVCEIRNGGSLVASETVGRGGARGSELDLIEPTGEDVISTALFLLLPLLPLLLLLLAVVVVVVVKLLLLALLTADSPAP